jgi:hypothetical protein
MGMIKWIGGRESGVRRSDRGRVFRRACAALGQDLEKLESRQLLSTVSVLVPGTADPYLADPANRAASALIADGTVPPSIPVTGSEILTISARGQTSNDPANAGGSPRGGYLIPAQNGSLGSISSWDLPLNSLVGVFVGDHPGTAPKPSTSPLSSTSVSPALGQVFFIGRGTTRNGQSVEFHAPAGATHLYLASLDGTQWDNNGGQFHVMVRVPPRFPNKR